MRPMPGRYIDVYVESNDDIPYDCTLRFHALDEPREVKRIRFRPDGGVEGTWKVASMHSDGSVRPARAVLVDDSSAGTSTLIFGADFGLRLEEEGGRGLRIAEPYLLIDHAAILD